MILPYKEQRMKRMLPYILMTFALLASVAGFTAASQRAAETERRLTEVYAAALYESMEETQALNLSLEKLLVSADAARQTALLCEVSRAADEVQRTLTVLPLSHEAMSDTLGYINRLSDYARSLTDSIARRGTLDAAAIHMLDEHRSACTQLSAQLVLANREMAVSGNAASLLGAFSSGMAPADRPLESISEPGNGISYPPFPAAPTIASDTPKAVTGSSVTSEEAMFIARDFVGADIVRSVLPAPDTGGLIPAYGVTVLTDDLQLNLEITKQGGHVLWMMPETASFPQLLNVTVCRINAERFLPEHGFLHMEYAAHQIYNGLCVLTFVPLQDNVLLYPDLIRIQVRMDTGDIVGLEAHNYLMNHTTRTISAPALPESDARALLSSQVDTENGRLCIIPVSGSEQLCWEFSVRYGDAQYRIYLNADTGSEIEVCKILPAGNGLQII